ncbi:hypothetical protein FJR38_25380 [Anabaena sp. UHCC 0253]|uniref:hypothetical protein n=1 Tax=Anabaena sp. UHCC 0253 TaxID=2590019 RepID=UPI0014450C17|nr:hypothetical protein [Anabaena sp. UHCC 0253]MTJ55761.1 hypothetical protein [Anabaena sp. UHCC 0253]
MTNNKLPKNHDPNRQNNRQKEDFSFRYRPLANTVDGKLIAYLQQGNKAQTGKEMVLQAIRICWLPLAYKTLVNTGVGISDQEVHRIGLICCHALEQHLAYLRMELGLPQKSSDVVAVPISTMTNPQTLATMFGSNAGNFSSNDNSSSQDQGNSNQAKNQSNSDSFIPGKGSFYDDDNDMFTDI